MSATTYSELKDLGDRFYKAKKWEDALRAYEEAERADWGISMGSGDFWFNRGFALVQLERWVDAKYAFERCTTVAPGNAAAWTNLGLCHRNLAAWQKGLKAYEIATKVEPSMVNAWKGLAICAEKLNNNSQRISACEVLVELLPNDSYWCNELGRAHLASGESSGVWRALATFLESARLNNDPCHPHNAALVYGKLNKWLDAGDAYREALHRKLGYAPSEKGLEEIKQRLEKLSAKVRDFSANLPTCKQPYERYLNPFEILAVNGRLTEMPDGATQRKLKQRVIQQIKLNDGRADWLEGAEIGESRVRQILDDLDDASGMKPRWHWVIYECPELNRFLSHGDPLYFAFFTAPFAPPALARPPYWQMRDKACGEEDFFQFIHSPFLANFEALLYQALELNDPELVQALSSGRLPAIDAFDYFRRASKWLDAKALEINGYMERLKTQEGIEWWKQTPDMIALFPTLTANALPNEIKTARTELGRALRALGIALHNQHGLTDQALKVTNTASQLLVDDDLIDQLKKDKADLERIIKQRESEEEEAARWNIVVKIRSDEVEINRAFIRLNSTRISSECIVGIRCGISRFFMNGLPIERSYIIEIQGAPESISIECKRLFRSETRAFEDYSIILNSVVRLLLPNLALKLAKQITEDVSEVSVGPFILSKSGARCEFENGKTLPLFSYDSFIFSDSGKDVLVTINQPRMPSVLLEKRVTWNACILEQVIEFIKILQSQSS